VPLKAPVIVAETADETATVVAVKLADVAPEATVTDVLTVAFELLEERLTTVPPVGAGPLRLTVPVDGFPPTTDVGFSETLTSVGGVMVNVAV